MALAGAQTGLSKPPPNSTNKPSQASGFAPVLISGAGPSGLLLALWLSKYSVPFRIVDKAPHPFTTSRAIIMHARTLELYRMLGLADDVLQVGTRVERFVVNSGGKRKGAFELTDGGKGQSYYPFVLSITQDEHEEILLQHLEKRGGRVERGVEVVGLQIPADNNLDSGVKVTLRTDDGNVKETMDASYVIGCDGAHSGVRHAAGIAMEGGTYTRAFFVADVFCHGDMQTRSEVNACVSQREFVVILALPHLQNRARVIGFVPEDYKELRSVTFEDCRPSVTRCAPRLTVDDVRWFATYKVHHRCASSFQHGHRVFLCGDSAHLHSPLGGQGMNTGLGDVTNLAWKLATAWHAEAGNLNKEITPDRAEPLLSTYTAERRPFADQLVRSNDRLFQTMISPSLLGWFLRNILLPYVFPFLVSLSAIRSRVFPRLSQIGIEYRESQLSEVDNGRGRVRSGDRLPWIEHAGGAAGEGHNHALLDGAGWQAHVFGTARTVPDTLEGILRQRKVPIHTFPLTPEAKEKGLRDNTLYLIRPDGHVGLVLSSLVGAEAKLEEYAVKWGVGRIEPGG